MSRPNEAMLARVAAALTDAKLAPVFVGGATIALYVDDPTQIRETIDVDCIVATPTRAAYARLERRLRAAGHSPDTRPDAPIYRWCVGQDIVDVMPTRSEILGFSNPVYPEGYETAIPVELPSGATINILAPAIALAAKAIAFADRGEHDPYASADLEDLVALLDGRADWPDQVAQVSIWSRVIYPVGHASTRGWTASSSA